MRYLVLTLTLTACSGLEPLGVPEDTDTLTVDETDAPTDSDDPWADDSALHTDVPVAWSHTPTIDGALADWPEGTELATSSGGTTSTYVSWDDTFLYVATRHPDVGRTAEHWWIVTLGDGITGSTTGLPFNTEQPEMAFPASIIVRWKSDDSWNSRSDWNGSAWIDTPLWLDTEGSAHSTDASEIAEVAIPRATLPGDSLVLHTHWLFEGTPSSSYAATPEVSFVDGPDPDLDAWLLIDLTSKAAPNTSFVAR